MYWYWELLRKSVKNIQISLQSDTNDVHLTWRYIPFLLLAAQIRQKSTAVQNNTFILLTVTYSSTIHTERIFAFPLQHRVRKSTTILVLGYAYIVCLFTLSLQILFLQMANYPVSLALCKRTLISNMKNQPLLVCSSGESAAPSTKFSCKLQVNWQH